MSVQQPFTYNVLSNKQQDENLFTSIEISKSAVDHNIDYYKRYIGQTNKLAIVIKSNGYGHGLEQMALIGQQNSAVDWLCVASLSEALTLDAMGITKPILVLGYATVSLAFAVTKNIAFMVDTLEYAEQFNEIGRAYGYQFRVHLKVDTGLSRLGVLASHASFLISQLKKLSYIVVEGVFSHFIASDGDFILTNHQLDTFIGVVQKLSLSSVKHIHMSNTHAITTLNYPSPFNFFRVGLGIYGFGKSNEPLMPALTWKTSIVAIKTIPTNSYVSYACTYKTTRATRIAILPVGYFDGYQLRLSNKGSVVINNQIAPVIGRVAMNMTIIDITNCTAAVGDIVTLIGSTSPVTLPDLASAAEMYNVRELLTGLNPAITRIIT